MKIKKTNRKRILFIAVEGDWPDCYKLNRYIKNYPTQGNLDRRSSFFQQVADLMWANWETACLAEWLGT
jgi:erythromycin esterase-like protein